MKKDLGFNKEFLIAIESNNRQIFPRINAFKQELKNDLNVLNVAASFNMPGTTFNRSPVRMETETGDIQQMSSQFMQIDYDYLETMQMELKEGRNFSRDIENSWVQSVLVNEEAVRKFGWQKPLGKRIVAFTDSLGNENLGEVIGVVKNFHANSLRQKIQPVIIWLITDDLQFRYRERLRIFVRIKSQDYRQTVDKISNVWNEFSPDDPIQFSFVDDQLNQLYQAEENLIILFGYFTFITIFIACLGLFGLAAFTAEQRTKEIGIRKVLGSSVLQIVALLSKDFTRLLIISFLIASPISYFFMNDWLQNFAYRTSIDFWIFVASGTLALLVALITVSLQTIKLATSNPVNALKYE